MTQNRIIYLAKTVSDIRRNEPRNIGVIVSQGSDICMRFKVEDNDSATKQWIDYWTKVIEDPKEAGADSDNILDFLMGTNSAAHYIEKAGEVILDLQPEPITKATDDLYERLVL